MFKETMTSKERILAAINLEPYDRVPVAPHLNTEFPFRRKGRPTTDAYNFAKGAEGLQFTVDLLDEVGGVDALTLPVGGGLPFTGPLLTLFALLYGDTMVYPGGDDRISGDESPPQFAEREILKAEDYDAIIQMGWHNFCLANMHRISSSILGIPFSIMPIHDMAKAFTDSYIVTRDFWHQRGTPVIGAALLSDPQMLLCLVRGLVEFTLDLYRQPAKVKEVLRIISRDITEDTIKAMRMTGPAPAEKIPGVMLSCERGSGTYFNLKIYEEFIWPWIKEQVEAYWDAGYVTTLHMDTNWTLNLPYLLELPPKSCIVELDSTTDIFKAKEILGNHMCIMGDVPPSLSSHGTPEEMREYCQKLIDIVGKDTGFILSTGCAVPPNTKFENFKMMIDTAKNYPPPRSK
jgi:uroporphyrinogen-III decarboxylase